MLTNSTQIAADNGESRWIDLERRLNSVCRTESGWNGDDQSCQANYYCGMYGL